MDNPTTNNPTNGVRPCSSRETFEEVTGVDIDADDWFGFETPREIGDSILRANRGTMSNTGAIPKAPNNIHSSQSIGGK